tara:strand:+ start:768 stop:2246 length:1479 start_codon:yes stop_codon:yes gene_type:complete
MRAALLIAGYSRSFKLNLPVIEEKILNKFTSVDVYIHLTKNEYEDDKYFNSPHSIEDIRYINDVLTPVAILHEDNIKTKDPDKAGLTNTWLKYFKLNKLKSINEKLYGKYDLVIKYRPDLNLVSDNIFLEDLSKDIVYIPRESLVDISKLRDPKDNHMCDIFAYGNSKAMDKYFDIYNHLDKLTESHGAVPETVIYEYLNSCKIKYKLIDVKYNVILSMCNTFAICGDSGSGKSTLARMLKQCFSNSFTLECDRYHKWERDNENWVNLTHLNPDANYITKMNNDIFDLKIGKSIYHVDYDHSEGKFTEKEKIDKSDNIIVCGLHSLYSKNDGVYNFKIFIDTDINLKTKWKVKRDTTERGQSADDVLEHIKSRMDDYYKYIYPQRELSDIIINFFTDERFSLDKLNEEDKVYLRVLVDKKYSLLNVLSMLQKKNIKYDLAVNDDRFNEITFTEYKKCNLIEGASGQFNNYYDYIVFIILSLNSDVVTPIMDI